MKPAPFEFVAAANIEQALTALAQRPGDARILAGGQTLGPMLNMRLASPSILVGIGQIQSLSRIEAQGGRLIIGAGVTHAMLEDRADPSPTGRILSHVASTIAYRAIRNRGTIGGSLAHADPAADWVTTMILLDADLTIEGPSGKRRVPMRAFMQGAFTTMLGPSDMLESIEITTLSPDARWGYYKICRKSGEFPDAIGAVVLDPSRSLSRIIVGALDGAPAKLPELAARVAKEGPAAASLERVSEAVTRAAPALDPVDLQLHAVAVRRAILQATAE